MLVPNNWAQNLYWSYVMFCFFNKVFVKEKQNFAVDADVNPFLSKDSRN